jgi:hypothetical protein
MNNDLIIKREKEEVFNNRLKMPLFSIEEDTSDDNIFSFSNNPETFINVSQLKKLDEYTSMLKFVLDLSDSMGNIKINKAKFYSLFQNIVTLVSNTRKNEVKQAILNSELIITYLDSEKIKMELIIPPDFFYSINNEDKEIIQNKIIEFLESLSILEKGMDLSWELKITTKLVTFDENFKEKLFKELLQSREKRENINNQAGINNNFSYTEENLKFRSKTEIKVFKELKKRAILFMPLPVLVFKDRKKEADFVIIEPVTGKVGILEINGDEYHTPETSAKDHERARLIKKYGIKVVEIFDATQCYNNPEKVIDVFIEILKKS